MAQKENRLVDGTSTSRLNDLNAEESAVRI